MAITFQSWSSPPDGPVAYGIAFQNIQNHSPLIYDIVCHASIQIESVLHPMRKVAIGNEVYFQVHIRDATQFPQLLFNPVTGVWINLYTPDGTLEVVLDDMTNEAVGIYSYKYQTNVITSAPHKGVWMMDVVAEDATGVVGTTGPMAAFVLQ